MCFSSLTADGMRPFQQTCDLGILERLSIPSANDFQRHFGDGDGHRQTDERDRRRDVSYDVIFRHFRKLGLKLVVFQ